MSYTLVLLRHGQSTWNLENRFTGWTDVDLSPKGVEEASEAGRLLGEAGFTFDVAYTSVLKRAIRTLWITLDSMDLMWWIPPEYWEIVFRSEAGMPAEQVDQFLGLLRNYSIIAVIQADISMFGAFTFYDKESFVENMVVEYIDADGNALEISHTEVTDPDVRLLLDQLRPVLAAAMGNMGENFYFFPLKDRADDGSRLVSPYEKGLLRTSLTPRKDGEASVLQLELPLDALFVPRVCPNGKPAHVTWSHCPWSGKKLR